MLCPKCKTENPEENTVCNNCNLKLKIKCPKCGTYNKIGQINCTNCNEALLKVCPHCKAINILKAVDCRKCAKPLNEAQPADPISTPQEPVITKEETPAKQEQPIKQPEPTPIQPVEPKKEQSLEKYTILTAELINVSAIKAKVPKQEMFEKLLSKFYQIFAKQAKENNEKTIKLNENTIAVEFSHSNSVFESTLKSIIAALKALESLKELNYTLESKIKTSFKIKMALAIKNKTEKYFAFEELNLSAANEIVVSNEIYEQLKNKYVFEPINETAYKFKGLISDQPRFEASQESLNITSRDDVFNVMLSKINEGTDGQIIALKGPNGIGKSSVISALRQSSNDEKQLWLFGQCCKIYKDVPLFFFKDLLKSLFELPMNIVDVEDTKNKIKEILEQKIGITEEDFQQHITSLLILDRNNLNIPMVTNKERTFKSIVEIFTKLATNFNIVMVIEDIEDIDKYSLELLKFLITNGLLTLNIKILATTSIKEDIQSLFKLNNLTETNTMNLELPPLSKEEIDSFLNDILSDKNILPPNILDYIYQYTKGIPVHLEEVLFFLMQLGLIYIDPSNPGVFLLDEKAAKINLPQSVEELIKLRLNNISQISPNAFKAVIYASTLGQKFMPVLVQNILKASNEEYKEIVEFLSVNSMFVGFDKFNFIFKNKTQWEVIYNLELSPENKRATYLTIANGLANYTKTEAGMVLENLKKANSSITSILSFLEAAVYEAYSVGDDYSYIELKKYYIELLEQSEMENKNELLLIAKEELAKICYTSHPQESIEYFSELIEHYDESDEEKVIDLLGFMAKSCEAMGNYSGSIECVDKAIEKIDKETMLFEYTLLNYAKLEQLLNLGRLEDLIVTAKTLVLPTILNCYNQEPKGLNLNELRFLELDTRFLYAKALVMQGNLTSEDEMNMLERFAQEYQMTDFIVKARLIRALAKVIQNKPQEAIVILNEIQSAINQTNDSAKNMLEWNFIMLLNDIFLENYNDAQQYINELSNYAANINACSYQPIIRGFIGKLLFEGGDIQNAINLYYELLNHCSENRLAIGALTMWSFYVEAEIFNQNLDNAMMIAQNALDVANNPTINNIFFDCLFRKKLAEIHYLKNEIDMAQMYAEQTVKTAQEQEYNLILAKIYQLYGKIILTKLGNNQQTNSSIIINAQNLFKEGLKLAQELNHLKLIRELDQNLLELREFCAKEGIAI